MKNPKTYQMLLLWLNDTRFDLSPRSVAASFAANHYKPTYWVVRKPIRMNDGTTASLQYSNGHYCVGTDHVPQNLEIWNCPHDDVLDPGRDLNENTDPYAHVPVERVVAYLDLHGGIMDLKTQLAMNAIEHNK